MQALNHTQHLVAEDQDYYNFIKTDGEWYIHLLRLPDQGWGKRDLQMAEGAHKFLNFLSNGSNHLRLYISKQPRKGAGTLELVAHCEAPTGGAIYLFASAKGDSQDSLFWILDLPLLVFGDMPQRFYVQRLPSVNKLSPPPEDPTPVAQYSRSHFQPMQVTRKQFRKEK